MCEIKYKYAEVLECTKYGLKTIFLRVPAKIHIEGAIPIHTPGHAVDNCEFVLEEESAIFTADNALGEGS